MMVAEKDFYMNKDDEDNTVEKLEQDNAQNHYQFDRWPRFVCE